jgi:TolB protein
MLLNAFGRWRAALPALAAALAAAVPSFAQPRPTAPRPGPAPAAPAGDGDGEPVVDVDGMVRSLPRASVVPVDASAEAAAREMAKLVALPGLVATSVLRPGSPAGGLVVRVASAREGDGERIEATSSRGDGTPHRRAVVIGRGGNRPLETARLADAVIADLTGERSHLSGTMIFTDASVVGERRVRVMLGSGAPLRDASPAGVLARGADVGPGGVVYYAAAKPGDMLQVYAEGKAAPVAVRVPGFLQTVSFSPDRLRAAVIAGATEGGTLYRGLLEGSMERIETGPGVALGPSFGPNGELAWAAGPAPGPLRVYVDGKPVTPPGMWASAPSFCPKAGKRRVAYMVKQGGSWSVSIANLDGGGVTVVGEGAYPVCSPDGRSIALVRGGKNGGVLITGEDGIAANRVRAGDASGLRWAPGPSLPPEG